MGVCYLHEQIVIRMVYYVTTFVNAIPATLGDSAAYYPHEIVTQFKLDIARDCTVQFDAYFEASDDTVVTNTMILRFNGCITLGPSGNW